MKNVFMKIKPEFRKYLKEKFVEFVDNLPNEVNSFELTINKKVVAIKVSDKDEEGE